MMKRSMFLRTFMNHVHKIRTSYTYNVQSYVTETTFHESIYILRSKVENQEQVPRFRVTPLI